MLSGVYRFPQMESVVFGKPFAEALAQEVKAFGVKVTIVEPGAYATDFGKSARVSEVLEPYADFRKQFMERLVNLERGDPTVR